MGLYPKSLVKTTPSSTVDDYTLTSIKEAANKKNSVFENLLNIEIIIIKKKENK